MQLRPEPYAGFDNPAIHRAIERFRDLATEYGTSMGALALAWAASHPGVTSVLAAPRNLDEFEVVSGALGPNLQADDRRRIAGATGVRA